MGAAEQTFTTDPARNLRYPSEFGELYPVEMGAWDVVRDGSTWKVRFRTYVNRTAMPGLPIFALDGARDHDLVPSESGRGTKGGW